MRFPKNGKWWVTRRSLPIEQDGTITVRFAVDPKAFYHDKPWLELTGTPTTLRRVAEAIEAHVASAEVNTEVTQ